MAPAPGQPVVAAPFRPSHDFPDDITSDDRTSAILVHVLGLLTGLFGVLILWLVKRDDSSFVDAHGKAAMNFHLSLIIYWFVSFIAALVLIGFLMMLVLLVLQVLFPILAAVAANRGERHTYPLTIPFIK